MLPYSGEHWRQFFIRAGREDLAAKYNFDDRHERNARIQEIYDDMALVTQRMSSAQCLALCEALDIAATRIYSIDELPEHPHLKAVQLFERQSIRPKARSSACGRRRDSRARRRRCAGWRRCWANTTTSCCAKPA